MGTLRWKGGKKEGWEGKRTFNHADEVLKFVFVFAADVGRVVSAVDVALRHSGVGGKGIS